MTKTPLYLILSACLLPLSLPISAELYKWTDEKGRVHYSDDKPEGVRLEEVKGTVNSYEAVTFDESDFMHSSNVVIYTKPKCGFCNRAKAFFAKNGIRYKEYKIESSALAKRKFERLNATGVPVIFVGKKRMNGFKASKFEKAFCKQLNPCKLS